jgi:succinate dehydrogenase flavin-adding protein (antitoxin of CptAB toxin-antitoxin module)
MDITLSESKKARKRQLSDDDRNEFFSMLHSAYEGEYTFMGNTKTDAKNCAMVMQTIAQLPK